MIGGFTLAGMLEGAVLGAAQAGVIRRALPAVRGWTAATAAGAGAAWFAGMAGSSLVQAVGPWGLVVALPAWILGLCSLGGLQHRQLFRAGIEGSRWFAVTTFAWCVGVVIPVIALSVLPEGWSPLAHVGVAIAAAAAMGATVGAITGGRLARIVAANERSSPGPSRAESKEHVHAGSNHL